MTRLTLTEAHELAAAILRHAGFSEAFAQAIAATVTAGERDGCKSHGLWRLLGIVRTLKAGKAVADAEPEVIDQAPSLVRVDAHGGFSQLAFAAGLPLLVDKARHNGIAAMATQASTHVDRRIRRAGASTVMASRAARPPRCSTTAPC